MLNKWNGIGRLVRDPEIRYTNNGAMVANFTLAVDRRFKREGQQEADFINIVAWTKTAEFVSKYFTKGQRVAVSGRIETRSWDKDGEKRYATEIIAEEVHFADGKRDGAGNQSNPQPGEPCFQMNDKDDLPF